MSLLHKDTKIGIKKEKKDSTEARFSRETVLQLNFNNYCSSKIGFFEELLFLTLVC